MPRGTGLRPLLLAFAALALGSAAPKPPPVALNVILDDALPPRLSDFRLFVDPAGRVPNAGVTPYVLNTPLFSDYAEKYRAIYVPPGKPARYAPKGVLEFPIGTVLIKSFGYPADMRAPGKDVRLIETRLLIRRASGWVALAYVWNAEGNAATLRRGGTRLPVEWIDAQGAHRAISYAVPNQNQCRDCHQHAGALAPIGPRADNLNRGDQLARLARAGIIDASPKSAPRLPRFDDPAAAPLAARARAYLDVNCAHCHSREGAASNSGLFLGYDEPAGVALGLGKRPVAAGRGSGGHAFVITPGDPERSILLYRMRSTEPGIAMPELGRATVHEEATALIAQWIGSLPQQ